MEIGYGIFIVKHLVHKEHEVIEVEKPKIFFKLDNALKYAEKEAESKVLEVMWLISQLSIAGIALGNGNLTRLNHHCYSTYSESDWGLSRPFSFSRSKHLLL